MKEILESYNGQCKPSVKIEEVNKEGVTVEESPEAISQYIEYDSTTQKLLIKKDIEYEKTF